MSYRQRRYHYGQENYCNYRPKQIANPKPKHTTGTWKPLPEWEKRFCKEVGGMPWRRFVEAKKDLCKSDRVFEWDDSAGLQAFNEAKQRFCENYHGVFATKRLPFDAADMYIDKHIDWDSKIDSNLFSEIKAASDDDEDAGSVEEIDSFSIPLEQIKATGWDCCDEPTPLHGCLLCLDHKTTNRTKVPNLD